MSNDNFYRYSVQANWRGAHKYFRTEDEANKYAKILRLDTIGYIGIFKWLWKTPTERWDLHSQRPATDIAVFDDPIRKHGPETDRVYRLKHIKKGALVKLIAYLDNAVSGQYTLWRKGRIRYLIGHFFGATYQNEMDDKGIELTLEREDSYFSRQRIKEIQRQGYRIW